MSPTPAEPPYTIDQLAAATGVPSRTIRLYQTMGLLPRPGRRGRVSQYGSDHVDRLRLVAELQDRGLHLSAIGDVLLHCDGEVTVRQWLGLGGRLPPPRSEQMPRRGSDAEMAARLSRRPPESLAQLLRSGLVQREGSSYVAASPGLLDVALALDDAGVDFETSAAAARILRGHLAQAVSEVILLLAERASDGSGRQETADAPAAAFEGTRVAGGLATRLILAAEVEQALDQLVAGGALADQPSGERST